jgi:Ca2+ transporting ATPase
MELLSRPPYKRDEYIISRKMVKHILGMSIYHIIVIYIIVFGGNHVYPEPTMMWRFDRPDNPYVYPGMLYNWDGSPLYENYEPTYGPSRHYTNVFNVFVILQIFNMINCRKINDEINVFAGIFKNYMFCIILFLISLGQALITEFGGLAMSCSIGGLPW